MNNIYNKKATKVLKEAIAILRQGKKCKKYGGVFCFNCTVHRIADDIETFL